MCGSVNEILCIMGINSSRVLVCQCRKLTLAGTSRGMQGDFPDSSEIGAGTESGRHLERARPPSHGGLERADDDEHAQHDEGPAGSRTGRAFVEALSQTVGVVVPVVLLGPGSSSATHSSSSARNVCHTAYATPAAAMMPAPMAR